jgi:hypothetical protein
LPFLLVEVAHDPLDKMMKTELAERAERVTAGTNWLPALLASMAVRFRIVTPKPLPRRPDNPPSPVALNWRGRFY